MVYAFTVSRVTSLSASGRSYGQPPVTANKPSQGRSISTTPDKDRITYPDDVIRDSYGNIVSPYVPLQDSTGLGITGAGAIGHLTDVNKSGGSAQQNLPFVVPSYASGILSGSAGVKVPLSDLLPPLSSGNYNYPELQGNTGAKPSSVPQQNIHQNEVSSSYADSGSAFGSTAPAVSTNFVSPPASSVSPPKTHGNYAVPPPSNIPQSPPQKPSTNPNQEPDQIPVYIQIQPAFGGQSSQFPNNGNFVQKPAVVVPPTGHSSNVLPTPPHAAAPVPHAQPGSPIFNTQHNQVAAHDGNNQQSDKYTGGFGGAAGVLGNQAKPGYAVTPAAPQAVTQQTFQAAGSSNGGSQPASSFPTAPSHVTAPIYPTTGSGSFGNGGHSTAPAGNNGSYGSGSSAFAGHPSVANGNDGKYTGGFGGPPGHLTPYDKVITVGGPATSNAGKKAVFH